MPATPIRKKCYILASVAVAAGAAFAQTAPAGGPAGPGLVFTPPSSQPGVVVLEGPASAPAIALPPPTPARIDSPPSPAAPAATAAGELPPVNQPFVATITGDKVYVRSGPSSTTYYEIGQLVKGDLVYVVGTSKGWYQILPPNGSFCLISKEYVDVDKTAGDSTGTVKADFVNIRAGSSIYKSRDEAILTIARKGTRLKIVGGGGAADKYYEIAPPDHAFFYINPQFLKAAPAGTEYKVPDLKLPAGVTGPMQRTVTAPTTLPTFTIEIPETRPGANPPAPPGPGPVAATEPAPAPGRTPAPGPAHVEVVEPLPTPIPAVTFSAAAAERFNDINMRYQNELKKPVQEQQVDDLLKDYRALLTMENLAPSVKAGAESRIANLEKTAVMQRLLKSAQTNDETLTKERAAMQAQWAAQEKALADHLANSPYAYEGVLQTSTIVQGKYALVDPLTKRTVAYVDPASDIDIGSLLGKYIGVKGAVDTPPDSDIKVIRVTTATLMAAPKQ